MSRVTPPFPEEVLRVHEAGDDDRLAVLQDAQRLAVVHRGLHQLVLALSRRVGDGFLLSASAFASASTASESLSSSPFDHDHLIAVLVLGDLEAILSEK
jgi:hypothetical protein